MRVRVSHGTPNGRLRPATTRGRAVPGQMSDPNYPPSRDIASRFVNASR
jgi:hypothetical protein